MLLPYLTDNTWHFDFYIVACIICLSLLYTYMQGLKVFDNKVENFASGAWQALGNVWKGSSEFVHKYVWKLLNVLF